MLFSENAYEILMENSEHVVFRSDANGVRAIGCFEVSSALSSERIRREKRFRKYIRRIQTESSA